MIKVRALRKEMFYLTRHSAHLTKLGYLLLNDVGRTVKDVRTERGNPLLPLHGLLYSSSKGIKTKISPRA